MTRIRASFDPNFNRPNISVSVLLSQCLYAQIALKAS